MDEKWTYKKAGVDVAAGERFVENIKKIVPITHKNHPVVDGIGGFSGIYRNPGGGGYLLASCDGVGTKILIAQKLDIHSTIGIDLVAMTVNDLLAQGGEPLFFLDYIAVPHIDERVLSEIIKGIVDGCTMGGCALLGGETAEMPGVYPEGVYDLAGFGVAKADDEGLLPKKDIKAGDLLVGLPSSGLHSNGYSLARKVLLETAGFSLEDTPAPLTRSLGETLLQPTIIYTEALDVLKKNKINIKGLAHITGGGLTGNIPRVLPDSLSYRLDEDQIKGLPIFQLISKLGNIDRAEMLATFNMGIGMVAIIPAEDGDKALMTLSKVEFPAALEKARIIGTVI